MIPVVQSDRHISVSHGLSYFRAGEDDILHGGAPQLLDSLFSQNPANRIRNITFTAAVRTYNTGYSVMKLKSYFVGKGFESVYLYAF